MRRGSMRRCLGVRVALAVLAATMFASVLGCASEPPAPTAALDTPATVAAGVATRIAVQPVTPRPTETPQPTPAPRAMPVPGVGHENHSVVVLGPGKLRDARFPGNRRYVLVGCYYEEEITGPRGPNANRELRFSYRARADADDTVTVSWGSSSERDLPERGCYELAVMYGGLKDYVRTGGSSIPGPPAAGVFRCTPSGCWNTQASLALSGTPTARPRRRRPRNPLRLPARH